MTHCLPGCRDASLQTWWRCGAHLALFLFFVALVAPGCSDEEDDGSSETEAKAAPSKKKSGGGGPGARPPTGVRVAPAEKGRVAREIEVVGEVVTQNMVELAPQESGQLVELDVDRGDHVEADAIVGRLDRVQQKRAKTEASRRVRSAEARLAEAEARLAAAKREVARRKTLVEKNAFPPAELERLKDDLAVQSQAVEVARSQVGEARAAASTARAALERRDIRAPFDGVVAERHVSQGAMVSPQTPIVTLVDDDSLRFVTRIAEGRLADVPLGSSAKIRLDALPDRTLKADVVRIGDVVDRESRTVELELAFRSDDGDLPDGLRHGMFGRGHVAVRELRDAVFVPIDAIARKDRQTDTETKVWTVEDDTAKPIDVTVTLVSERQIAVDGVEPGTPVIVSGTKRLAPGAPVTVARSLTSPLKTDGDGASEKKKDDTGENKKDGPSKREGSH